jgi:hypothetical protein
MSQNFAWTNKSAWSSTWAISKKWGKKSIEKVDITHSWKN